jgi:hypothetical protein
VFPVRYGLDLYILFRRNLVFKGLKKNRREAEWGSEVWIHVAEYRGHSWTVIGPSGSIKGTKFHGRFVTPLTNIAALPVAQTAQRRIVR